MLVDALALCWLGMWFGLRSRRAVPAILWSIGLVQGLDLAFYAVLMGLYALFEAIAAAHAAPTGWVLFGSTIIVPLGSIIKQACLIHWGRGRLKQLLGGSRFKSLHLNRRSQQPIPRRSGSIGK